MDRVFEVEKVIPNIIIRYIQQYFKYLHDDTGAIVTYMIVKENAVICIEGTQTQIDHATQKLLHIIQREYRADFQYDPTLTYEKPALINYSAFQEQDRKEMEKWESMAPVVKNIYKEHPEITMFPQSEVDKFRLEQNNISVSMPFNPDMTKEELSKIVPKPIVRFDHAFPAGSPICEMLNKRFTKPSPIQAQSWPIILSGHDMIGVAQTGTGKTLAFILPALLHIDAQPQIPAPKGPRVLVLSPTRELALQIVEEINKIGSEKKCICVYGGDNRHRQMKRVTQGYVDIVVATPGRLIDFMKSGTLCLDSVSLLILDEADRMLDLGFAPQIRIILTDIRPDRQIVLTTATWPSYLEWLAKQHTKDSIQVNVGSLDLQTVNTVKQEIIIIHPDKKELFLYNFMDKLDHEEKCLIFFGKKSMVDEVSSNMALKGYAVLSLHGGHDQCDREDTIKDFKSGGCNILLATDLASRGLDFNIEVVLNYDFPKNIEEYVHRVGRTGRAGRSGRAVTLMTRSDSNNASELIKILTRSNQNIPPELYELEKFHKERQERNFERRPNRRYTRN